MLAKALQPNAYVSLLRNQSDVVRLKDFGLFVFFMDNATFASLRLGLQFVLGVAAQGDSCLAARTVSISNLFGLEITHPF